MMAARSLHAPRPLPAPAQRESPLYQQIIDTAAVLCLARLIRLSAGRRGGVRLAPKGYPDLIGHLTAGPNAGRCVWIEVKAPGARRGKQDAAQDALRATVTRERVLCARVTSVQEAVDFLRGWVRP
jgi:hypothetical protein